MNRGDFVAVYLPKRLHVGSGGTYTVVNRGGNALGTVTATTVTGFSFEIPKSVLDQLASDGLVTSTTIDLFDDARNPTASTANMSRYLALLQQLAPAAVSDDL